MLLIRNPPPSAAAPPWNSIKSGFVSVHVRLPLIVTYTNVLYPIWPHLCQIPIMVAMFIVMLWSCDCRIVGLSSSKYCDGVAVQVRGLVMAPGVRQLMSLRH